MDTSEITWNDEARAKILADSDRVLRDAVVDLATTMAGHDVQVAQADIAVNDG